MSGYLNHYKQLQLLIKECTPQVICLQETHLIPFKKFSTPINYTIYTLNSAVNASGSVAILVHNSIQHTEIHLPQDFESLCSKIQSKYTFNIICSYILPRQHFSCNNLENVYSDLSTLTIITGGFNRWHTLWGSPRNNKKGNIFAQFIHQSPLTSAPTTLSHTSISLSHLRPLPSNPFGSSSQVRLEATTFLSSQHYLTLLLPLPSYLNSNKMTQTSPNTSKLVTTSTFNGP